MRAAINTLGDPAMTRVLASIEAELPAATGFVAGYLDSIARDIRRLVGGPASGVTTTTMCATRCLPTPFRAVELQRPVP